MAPVAAPSALKEFAEFCDELTLDSGNRMVLEPFQYRMLADYFDGGAVETLILVSKKQGKTTLLSAVALHHLLTTTDAECVIGAAARDQAQIMLRQIRGFINKNTDLQSCLTMSQREVRTTFDEGRIRVLSSEADSGDGVLPTLALVDELHRHRNADLYGVFRDGLGPRDGRLVTISTAGDDEESALGQMRARAYTLPVFEKDGAYRYARSENGAFVMHEWALDPDQNRDDMDIVKTANPASWQTVEKLRIRYDSPTMAPHQWARFGCGVWLQGEDRAISPVEWGECSCNEVMTPPEGAIVRIGIDVGWKEDNTALVVHWLDDEGVAWIPECQILVPPAEKGLALRKDAILDEASALGKRWDATEIVIDPENDGEVLAQDLEGMGFDLVAHSQKPAIMAQAAERFYAGIRERKIRHPSDPRFTRHVLNAKRKGTDDGRWRFVKESKDSKKVIDALIAAAMVHNVAVEESSNIDEFMFEVF